MTDIFQTTGDDHVIDESKDYLEAMIGEGGKFYDPDRNKALQKLARGKFESDVHIARVESETKTLRDERATRLRLEEILEKISTTQKSPSNEPVPVVNEPDSRAQPAITPEGIQELVNKTLTQNTQAEQRRRNTEYVQSQLQAAFGPTYARTVKDQASKLGVSEDYARTLAAEQPAVFLKLFDVTPQRETPSTAMVPPRSNVNSEAAVFKPNVSGEKRQSDYMKVRKTDPKRYASVAFQAEMHREAQRQGEAFFDM